MSNKEPGQRAYEAIWPEPRARGWSSAPAKRRAIYADIEAACTLPSLTTEEVGRLAECIDRADWVADPSSIDRLKAEWLHRIREVYLARVREEARRG